MKRKTIVFHCLATNRYYVNCLLDYCLPSLFHQGVDWFLSKYNVILLISTSANDSKVIKENTWLNRLELEIRFHLLNDKLLEDKSLYRVSKMMSEAHHFAMQFAMELKVFASFLNPDQFHNDRFLESIDVAITENRKALLAPALRMTDLDSFLQEKIDNLPLSFPNDFKKGIPSSLLVGWALNHLHPETNSFFVEDATFLSYQSLQTPTALLFRSRIHNQVLGYCMNWFIVMLNFENLQEEQINSSLRALQLHTMDADFLEKFLKNTERNLIKLARDSDEVFVVSWDKSKSKVPLYRTNLNIKEKLALIKLGHFSGIYDKFKLELFSVPWVWNATNLTTDLNTNNYRIPAEIKDYLLFMKSFDRRFISLTFIRSYFELLVMKKRLLYSNTKKRISIFTQLKKISEAKFAQVTKLLEAKFAQITKLLEAKFLYVKRILFLIVTFKRRIDNPLNQSIGGRIHAVLRFKSNIALSKLYHFLKVD